MTERYVQGRTLITNARAVRETSGLLDTMNDACARQSDEEGSGPVNRPAKSLPQGKVTRVSETMKGESKKNLNLQKSRCDSGPYPSIAHGDQGDDL